MFMQQYGWDHKEHWNCHVSIFPEVNENLPSSERKMGLHKETTQTKRVSLDLPGSCYVTGMNTT